MKRYYLGIDNGGTVIKVALYDENGIEYGLYSQKASIIIPKEGFIERDSHELLESVRICIQKVILHTNIRANDIVGISVSCHGKGLYLLGKNDTPAYNGIISSDSRASEIVCSLQKDIVDTIYNYSFQQLWTGHPAMLLRWFAQNCPKILENTKYIFMGHDYIRYYLTGEANAEITNMSGSALVDVIQKKYSYEILHALKLESIQEKLPPLVESTQQCGVITKKVSEETGLIAGTPVYSGFFDVVASAISSGLVQKNEINATMGTWAIATCIANAIGKYDYPYIWGNYCLPEKYFVHEGSPTSASNLEWFIKEFIGVHENVFEYCNNLVADAKNDAKLLFFPFLYASNIADTMRASFIGLQAHHTKSDVLKALYEGIIFSHAMHLERLYKIVGNVNRITLVGGPTSSLVWMQMFSNIVGHTVVIPNCKEAGCKGASLAAMVGSRLYKNFEEAVEHTVMPTTSHNPVKNTSYFRDKYLYYKHVGQLLKDS